VLEFIGVIASIKEYGLAVVPDKRRETPVENRASLLISEGVVEIQNRVLIRVGQLAGGWLLRQQQERVTEEQQGGHSRDISHGDLRNNRCQFYQQTSEAARNLSDCCRMRTSRK
jgi:hypothetical protein